MGELEDPLQTERWMCMMDVAQHMWQTGEITQAFGWTVLVLIPKGTTDNRGIGLLENIWKVVETLMDTRLRASLHFHDNLNRLRSGIRVGTDIMEPKLMQDLASVYHNSLFLVFLDLWKSYNNMDRDRIIHTLEVYGSGPCMCRLLDTLWSHQQVVPIQNGYHRLAFLSTQGTTQGSLLYPTLFNVVGDNVLRKCLDMTVEDQRVAHDGLREAVGRCLGIFYTNDGMVGSRDPNWLQHLMNVMVSIF